MVAGSKRRRREEADPLPYPILAEKLKTIDPRDSCLIAILYLSGRRINEVLHLTKKDLKIENNRISFETFNLKDYRKTAQGEYTIKRYVKRRKYKGRKSEAYEGLLYYRKIRPHFRTDSDSGERLTFFIMHRLGYLSEKDYLFKSYRANKPISYSRAYQIFRNHFPNAWLHILRHERFTEVFRVYKDDLLEAHRFTFHKRMESDLPYIRKLREETERI